MGISYCSIVVEGTLFYIDTYIILVCRVSSVSQYRIAQCVSIEHPLPKNERMVKARTEKIEAGFRELVLVCLSRKLLVPGRYNTNLFSRYSEGLALLVIGRDYRSTSRLLPFTYVRGSKVLYQGQYSPKQGCSCWFVRHSCLAKSSANLYPPGVLILVCRCCVVGFLWCYVCFVLFRFVSSFCFHWRPRPFVH